MILSYDICLLDPKTHQVIEFDFKHGIKGGTYALGGTTEAWVNITYNYAEHFYNTMGEKDIRTIYGMTGAESVPILQNAINQLNDDVSDDYWEPTEGNVKRALQMLLDLALLYPDGVWDGD